MYSTPMFGVRRNRRNGVSVDGEPWHYGNLRMSVHGPRRLVLYIATATPGHGEMDHLYQPEVKLWDGAYLHLRGIEPVEINGVVAAVVQEWLVDLRPSDARVDQWVAPGFVEPAKR